VFASIQGLPKPDAGLSDGIFDVDTWRLVAYVRSLVGRRFSRV
jgi:hypothetical protein